MFSHDNIKRSLTGISGILITPFDTADALAPDRQQPIVERAIAAGVHVLVANGNTSEFYALTTEEAEEMVRASARHIRGRVPLVGGVGRSVKDACRLAKASAEAGADALMVHQPPDPFAAPRGVVDYVRRIFEAAEGLPLVLYLRNDAIGPKAIEALCAIEGVIGVKWATQNTVKLAEAVSATDPAIVWVGGLAEVWAPPFYAVGARGFTSGLINVWPERSMAIHTALERGDFAEARKLVTGMRAFEDIRAEELGGTNVTVVKSALALLGHDCGATRPPSAWPLSEAQSQALAQFVEANVIAPFGEPKAL